MTQKIRYYAGQEIELSYDSRGCVNTPECIHSLPEMFDPECRPWIQPAGTPPNAIAGDRAERVTTADSSTQRPVQPLRMKKGESTMSAINLWRPELLFALLYVASPHLNANGPEVKTLVTKDLAGAAGQEALLLTVEYAPGVSEPVHRHNAQAFVYVLEGSVVMQVKGQPPVTLEAGDTFYEGKDDVHLVGRNPSQTKRARFVVFLVKQKGAPVATTP